ncbi:hypothetical protein ACQ86D_51320 [Streptomyces galilaeus]
MTGPLARLVDRSRSPVVGLRPRLASRYEQRSPATGPPVLEGDLEDVAPRPVTAPHPAAEPAVHRDTPATRVPGDTDPAAHRHHPAVPTPRVTEPADHGASITAPAVTEAVTAEPLETETDIPRPDPPTRAFSAVPPLPVVREDAPARGDGPPQPMPFRPVHVEAVVPPAAPLRTAPKPGCPAPDPRAGLVRDPADEAPPPTPRDIVRNAPVALDRPLLYAHARPPALAADAPPSPAQQAQPAVVVEVSIGRLDVRTPPSPAPPQTPARPPTALRADHARALESYLRRRAKGELG